MNYRQRKNLRPVINKRLNNNIEVVKMLVLDPEGQSLGLMSRKEALNKAKELGLDLLLVSKENAEHATARILDYGKFKYENAKRSKELKRKQSNVVNKEIRLRAMISDNDLQVKVNKARDFLVAKNNVKVSLRFRGREVTHTQFGYDKLNTFFEKVHDVGALAKPIERSGMFLNMYLIPMTAKLKAKLQKQAEKQQQ